MKNRFIWLLIEVLQEKITMLNHSLKGVCVFFFSIDFQRRLQRRKNITSTLKFSGAAAELNILRGVSKWNTEII